MRELEQKQKEHQSTVKEDAAYSTFQIINEMLCRGIELLPVDLYKSDAKKFLVEDGKIRLPFSSLPGVGEAAAHSLYEACTGGEEFISIDEVQSRAKVSSAVIDVLKSAGALQVCRTAARHHCFNAIRRTQEVASAFLHIYAYIRVYTKQEKS